VDELDRAWWIGLDCEKTICGTEWFPSEDPDYVSIRPLLNCTFVFGQTAKNHH